jgi:hydrogenase maturation factor
MSTPKTDPRGIFASRPSQVYCVPDAHGYCSTCADEALPATIQQMDAEGWTASVEMNGRIEEVDISLIEGAAIGLVVLVHGGVAIGTFDLENEK